jgi:hypothetical protein
MGVSPIPPFAFRPQYFAVEIELKNKIFRFDLVVNAAMNRKTHFAVGCTAAFIKRYFYIIRGKDFAHFTFRPFPVFRIGSL